MRESDEERFRRALEIVLAHEGGIASATPSIPAALRTSASPGPPGASGMDAQASTTCAA